MSSMKNPKTKPEPKITVDVTVLDPAWESPSLRPEFKAEDAVEVALKTAVIPAIFKDRDLEVSVALANDDLIKVLNRDYREKDAPTNVLSFAALDTGDPIPPEGPVNLGDVILAYQTIDREAREQGKYFKDHFIHLVVHGTLHLLGYDHMNDHDANIMESLEIRILEKLNIQNPYTETSFMA
jgi:probable rRNA maturation factor